MVVVRWWYGHVQGTGLETTTVRIIRDTSHTRVFVGVGGCVASVAWEDGNDPQDNNGYMIIHDS